MMDHNTLERKKNGRVNFQCKMVKLIFVDPST